MDYVNLGGTGLRVSRICLGMMSFGPHESRPWALPEEEAEPIVRQAIDVVPGKEERTGDEAFTRVRPDKFGPAEPGRTRAR